MLQDRSEVRPDFIMSSRMQAHTVVFEWKSGANTETPQLDRYSRVTPTQLVQRAQIDSAECKSHDVVVVGKEEHSDRLQMGIKAGLYSFPLLTVDKEGLALALNNFTCTGMSTVFRDKLEIDWDKVPTSFVPFDSESPDWEVAEVIIPRILVHMHERNPRIQLRQLAVEACKSWSIMDRLAQDDTCRVIHRVLKNAERGEFKNHFTVSDNNTDGYVTITANPLEASTDRRTADFRKMRTLQTNLLRRLRRAGTDADVQQGKLL